jgi:protein ImuB
MPVLRNLSLFPCEPVAERAHAQVEPRLARALREPPHEAKLSRTAARRLWLAIDLPRLALEAVEDFSASQGSLGVIDTQSRQQIVLACNAKAHAAGVRVGQSLNAAIALEPDLQVHARDAAREHARLVQLAAWCQRQFTPLVSLEPPDALLLEVKGSLKLFGGAQALVERLTAGLREQGMTARLALAPTPTGSLWLARSRSAPPESAAAATGTLIIEKPAELTGHLANVATSSLRWPEEVMVLLLNMGVHTVGDLMRLPRAGFARRLGTRWLDELDRAFDRRVQARRGFRSPERFDARQVLEHEIETAQKLESACGPLLERLQRFLREREAAIALLGLDLKHRTHPLTRLRIGLALPSGEAVHLRGLLAERLAALVLPGPVIALRLRSGALLPAMPANGWLWKQAHAQETMDALPRLIERLRARLGNERVFSVCAVADHRPECAWKVGAGNEIHDLPRVDRPRRAAERPLWLLAQPREIVRQGKRLRGPERIETGWWDGREVTRDYFETRAEDGARLWVYRERRAPQHWYVHGLFG